MSTTDRRGRGLFITFEGPDGSGKSTQLHKLAERLRATGRDVLETVEPGGTAIGTQIRRILLDAKNSELCPTAELLLMFASRAQNVDQCILPRLASFGPELIIISAGFDAHKRDPLANLQFVEEDFGWATRKIMEVADKTAQGRVVSVLEGGYDLEGLSKSAAAHVIALMRG